MAGQQLTTTILINAKTGSGFSKIGATLTELGTLVDQVSTPLIEFGKESIEVYKNYERSMAEVEGVYAKTYGANTRELSNVMSALNQNATEWAASTIFHTDDIANAINLAAHAGWDYEEVLTGIPSAIKLAQAGSLDLSEAVDYITKATHAAGMEFESIPDFIDMWSYAASSSATDIGEMGEAMVRMGRTMQFTGGSEELLTMIAILGDAGTVGSDAGTLLRNTMLRLVAPTDKAKEAMEGLGVETEELDEALSDESYLEAYKQLEQVGFSAYDENGNLKNMIDLFEDLDASLQGFSEQDANAILSAIFPTRSLGGALALLEGARNGWNGLYDELENGKAAGYGGFLQELMGDTLYGKMEIFESKVERLKQLIGEELAPDVENAFGFVGNIVDSIAGLDDGMLSALVSGLEVIAGAGPGLLIAGGAMRFIGAVLGSTVGTIGISAVALFALGAALKDLSDTRFEGLFGDNELDASEIQAYVSGIAEAFRESQSDIDACRVALENAATQYENTTSTFASKALTDAITQAKLSKEDLDVYNNLGDQIGQSLVEGITQNYEVIFASLNNTFGAEDPSAPEGVSGMWSRIAEVLNADAEAQIAKAEELSRRLREAMTSAFKDGSLTTEEVSNIQKIIDEQNQLFADQLAVQRAGDRARVLHKAQTLGLGSAKEAMSSMRDELDSEMEELSVEHAQTYEQVSLAYDHAIERASASGKLRLQQEKEQALTELDQQQIAQRNIQEASGMSFFLDTFEALMSGSDMASQYEAIRGYAQAVAQNGGIATSAMQSQLNGVNLVDAKEVGDAVTLLVDNLGGLEHMEDLHNTLLQQGDTESLRMANELSVAIGVMRTAAALSLNQTPGAVQTDNVAPTADMGYAQVQGLAESIGHTVDDLLTFGPVDFQTAGIYDQLLALAQANTPEGSQDVYSYLETLTSGDHEVPVTATVEEFDTSNVGDLEPIPGTISIETVDDANVDQIKSDLEEMGAKVDVDAETDELHASIEAENAKQLLEYVDGNTDVLHANIMAEDGKTLTEFVDGDVRELQQKIDSLKGQTITVNVVTSGALAKPTGFATGGRATQASIFGEAGPEWAIPEEHTARTAALLDAARAASGFTWPEILGRFGGLNANADNSQTTLVYSPTINANDATDVANVLQDDKKRFQKWFREMQMRDRAEVYA